MPFVYILRCGDDSLYTGAAKLLARRLGEHEAGRAAKYTRSRLPLALVWSLRVRDWRRALRLEWRIKRLNREEKLALIAGSNKPPRLSRSRRKISLR